MKMHMLPNAVLLLPNARLFHRTRHRRTIGHHALIEPNVAEHRDIPHDAYMRRRHRLCAVRRRAELK